MGVVRHRGGARLEFLSYSQNSRCDGHGGYTFSDYNDQANRQVFLATVGQQPIDVLP